MAERMITTRRMITAAAVAYLANCGLGAGVASGLVRTDRCRWTHSVLYATTATLTAAALLSAAGRRRRSGLMLLPAGLVMIIIPRVPARSRRHPLLALAAAPSYALSLLVERTTDDGAA